MCPVVYTFTSTILPEIFLDWVKIALIFTVNELVLKHRQRQAEKKMKLGSQGGGLTLNLDDIIMSPENLDLANINLMLDVLTQKKQQLEAVSFLQCTTNGGLLF
jgi:hypothetical protein